MKLKFAFLIVLAILFGFVSARVVYGKIRVPVSNGENIYFLQEGMSSDKNEFDGDYKKYDYIVEKIGDKYYAYVGITTNLSNANKIKKIYNNNLELIKLNNHISYITSTDVPLSFVIRGSKG